MSTRVIIVIAILAPPAAILLAVLLAFRADTFRLSLADLKGLYATDQSLFTEISGVYTHFQDEGEGFPIVLIHGSEGTLRTWDPVVSAMKDRYRMIRLELAGRGLSAAGAPGTVSDDVTLHGMVIDLLDGLGVEGPFHLVGQSSGGTIATRIAKYYPDRVAKLVVMNMPSSPVSVPRSARPGNVRRAMVLNDDYLEFRTRGFWHTYYSYLWGRQEMLGEELITLMYDQNRRVRAPMARQLIPANFSPEQADINLGGVVAPTLVIWAMSDPVLPPSQLEALTSRMTKAPLTVKELPGVGHFPALESPELIIPLIEDFLED
ncbi:MAG: alpha/beta fold hydrolase [Rhodospirillales bacterium]